MRRFLASRRARARVTAAASGVLATLAAASGLGVSPAAGRVRASRVYEDARVLSFLDIHPAARGDLLVIPKAHAAGLEDIDEALTADLFRVARVLAGALGAVIQTPPAASTFDRGGSGLARGV